MTQETTRDVIVYTLQDDNKINIIGEFESITVCVRTCNIEDVYIEAETQVAFVLYKGVIKFNNEQLKPNTFVTRGPRFNISYDSYEIDFNTNKIIGDVKGRYDLVRCMLDTISTGDIIGRKVVSLKVEGVAEYIKFIPQTVEDFIQNINNNNNTTNI
jgi:hypothetical protein